MLLHAAWFRPLRRPDVELIETPIERIDETGIQLRNGKQLAFDVIVAPAGSTSRGSSLRCPFTDATGCQSARPRDDDDPRV